MKQTKYNEISQERAKGVRRLSTNPGPPSPSIRPITHTSRLVPMNVKCQESLQKFAKAAQLSDTIYSPIKEKLDIRIMFFGCLSHRYHLTSMLSHLFLLLVPSLYSPSSQKPGSILQVLLHCLTHPALTICFLRLIPHKATVASSGSCLITAHQADRNRWPLYAC